MATGSSPQSFLPHSVEVTLRLVPFTLQPRPALRLAQLGPSESAVAFTSVNWESDIITSPNTSSVCQVPTNLELPEFPNFLNDIRWHAVEGSKLCSALLPRAPSVACIRPKTATCGLHPSQDSHVWPASVPRQPRVACIRPKTATCGLHPSQDSHVWPASVPRQPRVACIRPKTATCGLHPSQDSHVWPASVPRQPRVACIRPKTATCGLHPSQDSHVWPASVPRQLRVNPMPSPNTVSVCHDACNSPTPRFLNFQDDLSWHAMEKPSRAQLESISRRPSTTIIFCTQPEHYNARVNDPIATPTFSVDVELNAQAVAVKRLGRGQHGTRGRCQRDDASVLCSISGLNFGEVQVSVLGEVGVLVHLWADEPVTFHPLKHQCCTYHNEQSIN